MTLGHSYGGAGRSLRRHLGRGRPALTWAILSLVVAIVGALIVGVVTPARAGVGLGVTPTFPGPVTVGQVGVPGSLQIVNNSTTPDDVDPITIEPTFPGLPAISLVPSCGTPFGTGSGDCPVPDPGVFSINSPAMGEVGTACEGITFTVTVIDPVTGKVSFTPSVPFDLDVPGSANDTCRINFTYNVLKRPLLDSQPAIAGRQTSQIGFASGLNHATNTPGSGIGQSNVTVLAAAATIITSATPQVTIGSPINDTATVTGVPTAPAPTGTVVFTLFGPADPTCAGPVIFTSAPIPLAGGPPPTANSGNFTPTSIGTYNWVAVYSGDNNYDPVTSPCGAPNESSVIAAAQATIVTSATPAVTLGNPISDTATVTGAAPPAPTPSGTVVFTLFGPGDPTCAGAPVFTSAPITIAGGPPRTANSGNFVPTAAGTYNWVAVYSGDAAYNPVTSPCGAPNEASVVTAATPTIVTSATPTAPIGTTISDTATVTGTGGPTPTGTVTFTLFGPANATCAGPPIFTSGPIALTPAAPPTATATSGTFAPTLVGSYNWVAVYSGDANYTAVTSPCGAPNETSLITRATATIVTSATPTVTIGSPINDTATVTGSGGAPTPTGTVIFTLFGPANPTCAGPPIFTSAPIALAGGPPPTANSGNFTPTMVGTYNWVAVYSGDVNYDPVTSPCGAPNESSVVNTAIATIVTSATTPVIIGSPISDTATVTGAVAPAPTPTGTVVFTLFGPADPTCAGPAIFTSAAVPLVPGAPPTATANSGNFTPTALGTYNWVAVYSGDGAYPSVTSPCGAPNEASVVGPATPTIVTAALTPVTIGSPINDTATVTGSVPTLVPTGTVVFTLFGPGDPTCAGPAIFTSAAIPLAGGPPPTANSGPFTPTVVGTYNWVAVYSGDANYVSVTSPCGAPNEASVVALAQVAIATMATPTVTLGGSISDIATVTGSPPPAPNPTGTVVFTLFGPADPTCAGPAIFTSAPIPLAGGPPATANSGPFTPTAVGSYNWVAVYSGDANYPSVTSPCGAPNEVSVVTPVPTIEVVKTVTPLTLPEPGGDFTFNVVVTNTSAEVLTITSLTDDIYGDLTTRANSTCNTAIGTVLQPTPGPGNTYSCSFVAPFTGDAGDFQVDVVTVTATNPTGVSVTDNDDARVDLTDVPPQINIDKTVTPLTRPEPGGDFTYNSWWSPTPAPSSR